MKYGYARVSTVKQGYGVSLEEQKKMLLDAGASEVFHDTYTGTKADRPALQELLDKMKSGDTFIVCKMDRFARNTEDALALIRQLRERGIIVNILNMGTIDNSMMGKAFFSVMAVFAELERDMIVERTAAGIQRAKDNGVPFGRKKVFTDAQIDHALELLETHTYNEVAAMTKISKATIVRARRARKQEVANG